jgi:hypothetical protein
VHDAVQFVTRISVLDKEKEQNFCCPFGDMSVALMVFVICFQPDYDDIEEENRLKLFPSSRGRDKAKDNKKYGE